MKMNTQKLLGLGLVTAGVLTTTLLTNVQSVDAFVVHNGWNYTMDAYNDSTPVKKDGSGLFEIRGAAHKVIGDTVIFAINSSVNLENGVEWSRFNRRGRQVRAQDGRVDFSDLLINFTGKSLDQANGELFAINFAANGDSGAGALQGVGVYSNVTAKSVASSNSGWSKLEDYNNHVLGRKDNKGVNLGITPTHGDLAYDDTYFNVNSDTVNVISAGTKIGDIEYIEDLASLGLDFEHFGNAGSKTIAFSFDLGLLPSEYVNAMFHFAMECNNDIVAGRMNLEPDATEVPTPAAILPVIFGMFGAAARKKEVGAVNS